MWRFWIGLPIDLWNLLLRCVWWAIVPPGVNGRDFPWGHFLLRVVALGAAWHLLLGGTVRGEDAAVTNAVFAVGAGALLSLLTLTASAITADALGMECD